MDIQEYIAHYGEWYDILIRAGWHKAEKLYLFGIKFFLFEKDNAEWITPDGNRRHHLPICNLKNILIYGIMALEFEYYVSCTWDAFENLFRIQIDDESGELTLSRNASISNLEAVLIESITEALKFRNGK